MSRTTKKAAPALAGSPRARPRARRGPDRVLDPDPANAKPPRKPAGKRLTPRGVPEKEKLPQPLRLLKKSARGKRLRIYALRN